MDDKASNLILFCSIRKHIPGVVLHVLFEYLLAMHALCLYYNTSEKEKDSGFLIPDYVEVTCGVWYTLQVLSGYRSPIVTCDPICNTL